MLAVKRNHRKTSGPSMKQINDRRDMYSEARRLLQCRLPPCISTFVTPFFISPKVLYYVEDSFFMYNMHATDSPDENNNKTVDASSLYITQFIEKLPLYTMNEPGTVEHFNTRGTVKNIFDRCGLFTRESSLASKGYNGIFNTMESFIAQSIGEYVFKEIQDNIVGADCNVPQAMKTACSYVLDMMPAGAFFKLFDTRMQRMWKELVGVAIMMRWNTYIKELDETTTMSKINEHAYDSIKDVLDLMKMSDTPTKWGSPMMLLPTQQLPYYSYMSPALMGIVDETVPLSTASTLDREKFSWQVYFEKDIGLSGHARSMNGFRDVFMRLLTDVPFRLKNYTDENPPYINIIRGGAEYHISTYIGDLYNHTSDIRDFITAASEILRVMYRITQPLMETFSLSINDPSTGIYKLIRGSVDDDERAFEIRMYFDLYKQAHKPTKEAD